MISNQWTKFLLLNFANDLRLLQRYLKSSLSTNLRLFRCKSSFKCKRIVQYQALVHFHLRISRNRDLLRTDVLDRYSKSVSLTSLRLNQRKLHAVCQRDVRRISRILLKSLLLQNRRIDLLLRVCRSYRAKSVLLTSFRSFWSKCHANYQKSMQLSWISMISSQRRMRFLLLNHANELSLLLQKRRFLILRLHLTRYRKARSHHTSKRILRQRKLWIKHLSKALLMWRFWIKRLLLWSFCMTHFRKIHSHRISRIWKSRSSWIFRLLNISSNRIIL